MQNFPMANYYGGVPQNTYNQPYNNRYNRLQGNVNVSLVSNIKEAEAAQPDPLGNPTFFFNMGSNEIYMKQFNNMGLAPLYIYKCAGEYTSNDNSNPIIMDYDKQFKELGNKIDKMTTLLTSNVLNAVDNQQIQQLPQQGNKNVK